MMKRALWLVSKMLVGTVLFTLLASGTKSTGQAEAAERDVRQTTALDEMTLLYSFSGVSDDGQQGSANRKEATSIHCTNLSPDPVQVLVQLIQWNGTDVFTGTVNMPPGRTFTFSTQNTTIYFDDVILGGSPGTDAIFQGSGQVLADNWSVICSAQVLDPLNYPPVFADRLPLYDRHGDLVKGSIAGPDMMFIPLVGK